MSFKIGNDSIKDIYVGSDKIGKIYVGSALVYNAVTYQNDNRFAYSGVDASGHYDFEYEYDGTAVAYVIGTGSDNYTYDHYTQITTPTTKAGYNGYYVKSGTTYTACSYNSSSDTLTPSSVVVGTTPAYSRTTEVYHQPMSGDEYVLSSHSLSYAYVNGLNPAYFTGVTLSTAYSDIASVPDIGISTLVLPDRYNGKIVKGILPYALYGYFDPGSGSQSPYEYYVCSKISNLTLGRYIQYIKDYGCNNVCVDGKAAQNCTITFNELLHQVSIYAFGNAFKNKTVVFPYSLLTAYINALAFGSASSKIIIANPNVSLDITGASVCLGDVTDWLVFQDTVTSINTTYFRRTSGYKSAALVFKNSTDALFSLDRLTKLKSAMAVTIYTDNAYIRSLDWASKNYTVTFKALSEYPGD